MDPLILMGAFFVGGAGGYVVGAQAVAEKLRPGIDRMAERVAELEGELLDAKKDKGVEPAYRHATETEILERWLGRQLWP